MSENQSEQSNASTPVASGELLGAMYQGSDGAYTCALCNYEMEWGDCCDCGGDGYHDAYEDDPNFYDPGDTIPCHNCNSGGGDWWCPTNGCPTQRGIKVIPAPKV